jgi:DNA polymerase III delta prime subunit
MKQIWVEKYRPKTVADVIVTNDRDRQKFDSYVTSGEFPNMLLEGGPGTGKSSMSLALVKTLGIDKTDVLKINCSDEKIDALRDKVKNFAMTMSMGKFKVVRLEEIDGIGEPAQKLLRDLIEVTSRTCRFIATCNYGHLVIPALRSRFIEYSFYAPSKDDVLVRAAEILEAEKVEFEIDDLEKTVSAGYPDMRKIIQLLESNSIGGRLSIDGGGAAHDWKLGLLPLIEEGDINGCRKLVCETASPAELIEVYRFLYKNLYRCKALKAQDEAIVLCAQYQKDHPNAYDPELHIAALFIEIAALL